jgi:hypothetical protein
MNSTYPYFEINIINGSRIAMLFFSPFFRLGGMSVDAKLTVAFFSGRFQFPKSTKAKGELQHT